MGGLVMKILKRINLLILLFLTVGICYGQNDDKSIEKLSAEEIWKLVEWAYKFTVSEIKQEGVGKRFVIRGVEPLGDENNLVGIKSEDVTEPYNYSFFGNETRMRTFMNPVDEYGRFNPNFQVVPTVTYDFPFGDGTVYTFKGKVNLSEFFKSDKIELGGTESESKINVADKLKGYIFEGDSKDPLPLAFAVIKDIGFVYVSGKGKVILPDGNIMELGVEEKKGE